MALFAAHAAGVAAIETVYPDMRDLDGLKAYAARGRRDGRMLDLPHLKSAQAVLAAGRIVD